MLTALVGLVLASGEPTVIGTHSYNEQWKAGYSAGQDAAEQTESLRPLILGTGAGTALAGTGVFFCGIGGAPCVAIAPLVPAIATWQTPPTPEHGGWENEGVDYQNGYIVGYQDAARRKQSKAAAVGGTVGAVVGTGAAIGALFVADSVLN